MLKKILITGGAGFIGSHLAEKLVKQGHSVFVLDDLSTGTMMNLRSLLREENFVFTEGSVLDEELVAQMVKGKDEVYHLAAAVGVKMILGKPLHSLLTNVKGAEIVLQEAAKKKVRTLITSTSEVCGKGEKMPFREDDDRTYGSVYNDRWVYAFSKAVDEFLALAYWRERGLPVTVVRLFNVIGIRQTGAYGMVVPNLIQQALEGKQITVFGDGKQSRCFADVDDITNGFLQLMAVKEAEGEVFNLGSDEEISINDLAKKIKNLTDSQAEIIHIPYDKAYREGFEDFKRRVPDLSKVKKLVGYDPKNSLEDSLKKIIEYQKNQK